MTHGGWGLLSLADDADNLSDECVLLSSEVIYYTVCKCIHIYNKILHGDWWFSIFPQKLEVLKSFFNFKFVGRINW